MRSLTTAGDGTPLNTTLGALVLGATATATSLLGAAPAHAGGSTTEHQSGIVIECTGSGHGHSAYVDLYENDPHGNYVRVIIDQDPKLAASREPKASFWNDGRIAVGLRVGDERARIVGTAARSGPRRHVHEVHDDAGNHIVADGFHRHLANDLVLRYAGNAMSLTCAPAFFYSLDVTTMPIP